MVDDDDDLATGKTAMERQGEYIAFGKLIFVWNLLI